MFIDENLDFDIVECTSRFTLNSAGRSPATRRAEQRQRSVQRRARANPLRMIHDDGKLFGSPSKEALPSEELSFYQSHSPQQSPRPCSPCTICPEEDALMGELLPSESNTPNKHQPILQHVVVAVVDGDANRSTNTTTLTSSSTSTTSTAVSASAIGVLGYNRVRRPLEDHDTNSMDSGYGASVLNDGGVLGSSLGGTGITGVGGGASAGLMKGHSMFRFATSSSSGSMSRHSSSSPSSRRLLSSLSSGSMESMDDLELFDMEAMQDEELSSGRLQQQHQQQKQHFLHQQSAQQHQQQQQQLPEAGGMLLPSGLNTLICGTIKTTKTMTTPELKRPFVRRCLSLTENTNNKLNNMQSGTGNPAAGTNHPLIPSLIIGTPTQMKTPEQRFGRRLIAIEDQENCNLTPFSSRSTTTEGMARCFKRPEPPGVSPVQSKRCKTIDGSPKLALSSVLDSPSRTTVPVVMLKKPVYQKSISMNDAQIMSALSRSSSEPDLIGDFSKSYVLPLMEGQHRDLKSISGDTMARLLRGEFRDKVASFKIIDCRYPYEFDGGHIRGAKNLYTQEQIIEELINGNKTESANGSSTTDGGQQDGSATGVRRNIIVFHCEFSSERGPKLSRFLRNHDRIINSDSYPALHYPEIYLLHGGYKEFFKAHATLCDPIAYRPMLDPEFGDAYRHFRAKSRSWSGDGSTCTVKATKTRSRLVL
ncbi:M-phase inducer phosphatase-like [Anopheles darlingi]|uniref:M-phase inducer phosphatase-like n=1 Tax=Anopheles darlingi TaxID=43151 RepID=UPI00210020F8|nr:M-phase inducer phosphatase-like [Anopheles darlingi]